MRCLDSFNYRNLLLLLRGAQRSLDLCQLPVEDLLFLGIISEPQRFLEMKLGIAQGALALVVNPEMVVSIHQLVIFAVSEAKIVIDLWQSIINSYCFF